MGQQKGEKRVSSCVTAWGGRVVGGRGCARGRGADHVGDQLRRVLQVGVDDHDRLAARPGGIGRALVAAAHHERHGEDDGEEETAMTLPLAGDRGGIPNF